MKPNIDIINREIDNYDHIYIYPLSGKAWVAYGQSAINLHLLLPNINYRKQPNKEHIEVMTVDQASLDSLLGKVLVKEQTSEMITLPLPEGIF